MLYWESNLPLAVKWNQRRTNTDTVTKFSLLQINNTPFNCLFTRIKNLSLLDIWISRLTSKTFLRIVKYVLQARCYL